MRAVRTLPEGRDLVPSGGLLLRRRPVVESLPEAADSHVASASRQHSVITALRQRQQHTVVQTCASTPALIISLNHNPYFELDLDLLTSAPAMNHISTDFGACSSVIILAVFVFERGQTNRQTNKQDQRRK